MAGKIQAVRGMNDILPTESWIWQIAEQTFKDTLQSFGYHEIRFPIVEKTELFKRSIGEITDIVEKEMYTFIDRNEDSLTLRPEGTACCVRACLEHGITHNQTPRLWYQGPYFRHERPQKGRYRQFHQIAAEIFGLPGPDIDAELILLSAAILDQLGILPAAKLELNSLGSSEARAQYRKSLVSYFKDHQNDLDDDSLRRLEKNPLRILDSKNPSMKALIKNAPKLTDHLDEASSEHFDKLQDILSHAGVEFEINPCLVRGLDYYNRTVFEWTTDQLGAQGTLCAGGRYDDLVEQLGGRPTPALGFAFGVERTILLMQALKTDLEAEPLHAYLITDSDKTFVYGLKIANYLREKVPGIHLLLHCGGGSLKNQFKKADKSGAQYAIIVGEHEMKTHSVGIKPLREDLPQQPLLQDELAEYLKLKISQKES